MSSHLVFSQIKFDNDVPRLAADQSVASLARPLTPLTVDSPISKAIETLRQSNLDSYPVISGARVVTLLSEADLAALLLPLDETAQEYLRTQPLGAILNQIIEARGAPALIRSADTVTAALEYFSSQPSASIAAVVDNYLSYSGVICRSDLLAYRFKTLAPARVGGMATPLGVYLTDGVQTGGVGNLALFLAGITLTCLFAVAIILSNGLDVFLMNRHIDVNALLESQLIPLLPTYAVTLVTDLRTGAPLLLMLVLLRLIPVAGYHAAEHQVVHCIERGEPLLPRIVARMPRPHPRCGTNLVTAVLLFSSFLSILIGFLGSTSSAVLPAVILTVISWRHVGSFMQQYFTTRPASEKQLASGIRAGQDLLAKYRVNVNRRANVVTRLWRMGIVQMFAGSCVLGVVLWLLDTYVPVVQPYLQGIY